MNCKSILQLSVGSLKARSPRANREFPIPAAIALCAAASLATAQTADEIGKLDLNTLMGMEVTLVTAQKRTEDVNAVPISMTVLKSDAVAGMNMKDTTELQLAVPGLTTTSGNGSLLPYIRGVGTDILSTGVESSVAVYVDGVYQASQLQSLVDLFDVDQIEVLKGPQGTLYGRNATGGAINITTRRPTDSLNLTVDGSAGNLGWRDGRLFLSGPVGERLKLSVAAHVHKRDGDVRNLYDQTDVDNEDYYSLHARAQLDITPALRAEVLIKYFSRADSLAFGTQYNDASIPALLGIPVTSRPYFTDSNMMDRNHGYDTSTSALKINWDFSFANLQSLTAYGELRHHYNADIDASIATLEHFTVYEANRAFTQELQLSSARQDKPINWLIGAFFINAEGGVVSPYSAFTTLPDGTQLGLQGTGSVATQAFAGYGEATWSFNQLFSVTGGLRYSNETKHLLDSSDGIMGVPLVPVPNQSHRWDAVNYRLVAQLKLGRSMVYAKTETAFKSGAYNDANPETPGPINPETITAYEVGAKIGVAELPLWLDFAAFYNDYRQLQIQVVTADGGGALSLVQAPRAVAYGLDTNLRWRINSHWNIASGISLQHATYRDFTSAGLLVPSAAGGNSSSAPIDLSGNYLSRSPGLMANLAVTGSYPLGTGQLSGSANYYRSSRLYFEPTNFYSQGPYGALGARFEYQSSSHWNIAIWGRNLTDSTYRVASNSVELGTLVLYVEPRTYGLTLGYSFGR